MSRTVRAVCVYGAGLRFERQITDIDTRDRAGTIVRSAVAIMFRYSAHTRTLAAFFLLTLSQTAALQQPVRRASGHLDRGIELAHAGKFSDAAEEFLAALAIDPKLSEAHYLLGLIRQTWGKWADARDSYAAALRLKPRYSEAQLGLAAVLTRMANEQTLDTAIGACRQAIALNPTEAEPHFHLAANEALKGNFETAAAEYRAALRLRPDYPGARLGLADALLQLRATDEAVPMLKAIAAAQPQQSKVHQLLGVASSRQGEAQDAVEHLMRAALLDPDNPQTRYLLAANLRKLGRTQEADVEQHRFKQLTAGRAKVMQARYHLLLAQKLLGAGKLAEAIGEYRESLSFRQEPAVAVDLGVALLSAGRIDEAIETLRDVIADAPKSALGHYHLGLAYAQRKDYENARPALERSLQLRPDFSEALFNLGMICAMQGQPAEAERHLRQSIRLRPDLAPPHFYLGTVLRDLGKSVEAEAEFLKARQLDAGFSPEGVR